MCWVGVVVCAVLAGCASAQPPGARHTVRPLPPLDTRLVGTWHVVAASIPGRGSVHADDYSQAVLLEFRPDALLITNGSRCGAPHAGSTGTYLELRWRNGTVYCSGSIGGGEAELRLADALDRIQWGGRIRYSTDGMHLRLAARGYRILLGKGVPAPPPQTLTPSVSGSAYRDPTSSPCCH
jgi:hypothetical protein